jgi:hypothetical protein
MKFAVASLSGYRYSRETSKISLKFSCPSNLENPIPKIYLQNLSLKVKKELQGRKQLWYNQGEADRLV